MAVRSTAVETAKCTCGKPLRDPISIARRMGPVCWRRLNGRTPRITTPTAEVGEGQTALDLVEFQPTLWSV
ncbi:DUF6011 domain-containing protein [Streptomyces prunicolor]